MRSFIATLFEKKKQKKLGNDLASGKWKKVGTSYFSEFFMAYFSSPHKTTTMVVFWMCESSSIFFFLLHVYLIPKHKTSKVYPQSPHS